MAPSLEELLNSGLGGIIQGGGLGNEEAMYQRQAQAERESTFGRGLGISSVTRDALAKARVDASLAAQSAQLSALGQAAGVTQGNANRAQQESQFGRNLSQQKDLANTQLLAGGIGAGVGALGSLAGASFGPEIRGGVRGMFGLGPLRQDQPGGGAGGGGVPAGGMPGGAPPTMPSFDAGPGGGGSLPDLSALGGGGGDFSMPSTSFGSGDLNFGGDFDFGGDFGGFDLGGLFDYDPYEWGSYL